MTDEVKAIVAAAYVEYVRDVVLAIKLVEDEVEELRAHLTLSGQVYGDMIVTSPTADKVPDGVIKLMELLEEKDVRLAEYAETYRDMSEALEKVEEVVRDAFTYHYLHLMTWEEVCVKMNYSYQGMMGIRQRGLVQLYDVMPREYRDVLPKAI